MSNTVNIYVNKTDLGLNNVDNTSDVNKPISTATQTALDGKEDESNKTTDVALGTSDVLYPSQKAVKTYVDTATSNVDTITTSQTATLAFRFDKKHIHATSGIGGALAPLTGNITLFAGTNHVNVTSIMLHNDSVEPTFSAEFTRSSDSLPYLINNDNVIVATVVNQMPTKVMYKILRGGANIYGTFLTTDLKGAVNGLAELDGTGKVASSQLPSYVDDVEEYTDLASFPATGESGKIYIAQDTNLTYRWSGSAYVEISSSLALGETISTAYRGDRGKTAYDHSQVVTGNPHGTTTADITDTLNKRYQTDAQQSYNDATSSIQTQLNSKQASLGYTAEDVANKQTDLTASATKYPTVDAVNTGLDTKANLNITLNRQTGSYVAVASDNGKLIEMNVGSANTFTINTGTFVAGNQMLLTQYGAGQTTITAGVGVTLRGSKLKTNAQYSMATIVAISSTEFYVAGDLTA